jgi:hypothetical protein
MQFLSLARVRLPADKKIIATVPSPGIQYKRFLYHYIEALSAGPPPTLIFRLNTRELNVVTTALNGDIAEYNQLTRVWPLFYELQPGDLLELEIDNSGNPAQTVSYGALTFVDTPRATP